MRPQKQGKKGRNYLTNKKRDEERDIKAPKHRDGGAEPALEGFSMTKEKRKKEKVA